MPTPVEFLIGLRETASAAALAAYATGQLALAVLAAHRWTLLRPVRALAPAPAPVDWPSVTVQLPVFNEPLVVERLIRAACGLDYPADRLEIQVLDDSVDETVGLAAAAVARARALGVDAHHVRRASREGFKAGALAAGLARARGELVAIFDADFVPPRDFLRRLVPHFTDPTVGLVQARWGHLNAARSWLTRAQAVLLDAHFLLEHAVRRDRGYFLNFNGTAGVWRRRCIDDAGGWAHDTLTEDLDLSYRAQMRGWRFVFDPSVVVPGELPADMDAFESQQRRWAKGALQTARKLLPAVWRSRLPWRVRVEATLHLTANLAYPLVLALGLLMLPVLLARSTPSAAIAWTLYAVVLALGAVPVAAFLARGQLAAGVAARRVPARVLAALVLGAGLSLHNAVAVIEGLTSRGGVFVRTPKTGDVGDPGPDHFPKRVSGHRPAVARHVRARVGEWVLALWFAAVLAAALARGDLRSAPFLILLVAGLAWVGSGVASPVPGPRRG